LSGVVVGASTALAWCFPDESSDYADVVLVGERTKRLREPVVQRFTALLDGLLLTRDSQSVGEQFSRVLPLARAYRRSAYDAVYLELAIRYEAPLATLYHKLQKAAQSAGVTIFRADE
jgi:predicted nucleic acid-binding protein